MYVGFGSQQGLEAADYVSGEQLALQVGVGVLQRVEAMQHLHFFVAYQLCLGLCALDLLQERLLVLLVNAGSSTISALDHQRDL